MMVFQPVLVALPIIAAAVSPISKLPSELADEVKWVAFNYGWMAVNNRRNNPVDEEANRLSAERHWANMRTVGSGLLTGAMVDDINWMSFNAAWAVVNSYTWMPDYQKNYDAMNQHEQTLKATGLFTHDLLENVKWMAWNTACASQNDILGNKNTQKECEEKFDDFMLKISGPAVLKNLTFDINTATLLGKTPSVVSQQTLVNHGDVEQRMAFTFSYYEGQTSSYSKTAGFTVRANAGLTGKFFFANFSFEASYSDTWSTENEKRTTQTNTFSLNVPKHSTYEAKGIVTQANMDVPYTATIGIGSGEIQIRGIWHGVAVAGANVQIDPVLANATTLWREKEANATMNETFPSDPVEAMQVLPEKQTVATPGWEVHAGRANTAVFV